MFSQVGIRVRREKIHLEFWLGLNPEINIFLLFRINSDFSISLPPLPAFF